MEFKIGTGESSSNKINCDVAGNSTNSCAINAETPQLYEITINQAKDFILSNTIVPHFVFIREAVEKNGTSRRIPTRIFCLLTEKMVRALLEIIDDEDSEKQDDHFVFVPDGFQKDQKEQESENENKHSNKIKFLAQLNLHQKTQQIDYKWNEPAFKCNLCPKLFLSKQTVNQHIKAHQFGGYNCVECGTIFGYKRSLKKHIAAHQKKKQKPWWKCDKCQCEYKTEEKLERHRRLHTNLAEDRCKQCNRVFSNANHLQRHIKMVHLKVKSFPCSICGLSFSTEPSANNHKLRIHYREEWMISEMNRRNNRKTRGTSVGSGA